MVTENCEVRPEWAVHNFVYRHRLLVVACSSLIQTASCVRLPSTTSPLDARWMKHWDLCRHSSSQINTVKVSWICLPVPRTLSICRVALRDCSLTVAYMKLASVIYRVKMIRDIKIVGRVCRYSRWWSRYTYRIPILILLTVFPSRCIANVQEVVLLQFCGKKN